MEFDPLSEEFFEPTWPASKGGSPSPSSTVAGPDRQAGPARVPVTTH